MKRIGIAGATGLVGETLLRILEASPHKVEELRLFASSRSAGTKLSFRDRELEVQEVAVEAFTGLDIAFFCLENELARKLVPQVSKLCPVIDKSSEFRLQEGVPLVVPEVNPEALKGHKNIIANPNCTTIPLVVALYPLHCRFGLEKLSVATYQSVSGAGRPALEQLLYETEFLALHQKPDTKESPLKLQIADNLIPKIGPFDSHGNSEEELKLIHETRKILGLPGLKINVTCVRVPVTVGHSLAVTCRFSQPVRPKDANGVLKDAAGVLLDVGERFATPLDCRGKDLVYVSRVRQGAEPEEISLWVLTDNLRKGAALNALQIAELLFQH
ncbi:MAG: aspartate-semialdehyde dehydrogenase [candidate division WOR-3 bacterium]